MPFPQTKDPNNPTDLMGRPLDVGDYVAWGISRGSSGVAMSVGRIERINFTRPKIEYDWEGKPYEGSKNEPCCPPHAKRYTVAIKPLSTTSYYHSAKVYDPSRPVGERFQKNPEGIKTVTIQKVENLVKVELPDGE